MESVGADPHMLRWRWPRAVDHRAEDSIEVGRNPPTMLGQCTVMCRQTRIDLAMLRTIAGRSL